jgi:hypothetical protein
MRQDNAAVERLIEADPKAALSHWNLFLLTLVRAEAGT